MKTNEPIMPHPKYRPDIDGLRAVAVLSVVVFHAFPQGLQGGFIGVDVFFVISGFLISRIILEELEDGSFSFSEFYKRRVLRIFPALFLVLSFCIALGWAGLLSDEYEQLGRHTAAGAAFFSNLVLHSEVGYFDVSAETKPLLHLWSLGVEEQFYILWPFMLYGAWRARLNAMTFIVLCGLASFVYCLNVEGVGAGGFYLPQVRFWELLAGASLACYYVYHRHSLVGIRAKLEKLLTSLIYSKRYVDEGVTFSNLISLAGALLLLVGFLAVSPKNGFPGAWPLLPVCGAMLIISAGQAAWINRKVLSNRIVVWFGLISFPLYLWHWPLLSFARIFESELPSAQIRASAALLSIFLAWLTYRFVERPIRFARNKSLKVPALVVAMVVIFSAGVAIYQGSGFPNRLNGDERVDATLQLKRAEDNCNALFPDWTHITDNPCRLQKKVGNTLAIIGDSHAGHLYVGMSELVGEDVGVANFAASCAAPYLDISSAASDPATRHVRAGAYNLINSAYEFVIKDPMIKVVMLAHNPGCSYSDIKDMANPALSGRNEILEAGMRRSFSALQAAGKRVVVILDNPPLPYEPQMCAQRPIRLTKKGDKCFFSREFFDSLQPWSNYKSLVQEVLKDYPGIGVYDLSDAFCDSDSCRIAKGKTLLYADVGHLSHAGSRFVAPFILNAIAGHHGH